MKTLVLNSDDMAKCLDYLCLSESMEQALSSLSSGKAKNFSRHVVELGSQAVLGFMPALESESRIAGYKVVGVFQGQSENKNPHQGLVALIRPQDGAILCLLNGETLTAFRTAATSVAATRHLAKKDATSLALVGCGRQAEEHYRALRTSFRFERIFIWSRNREKAKRFQNKYQDGTPIVIGDSPEQTVYDADIVVTATSSKEPILKISDFKAGCHINAIGACRPGNREIEIFDRENLKIYLDSEAAVFEESDELITAISRKQLSKSHIVGEIGRYFQTPKSRIHGESLTLFKSVGLGIQDLYAASYFFHAAAKQGAGIEIDF